MLPLRVLRHPAGLADYPCWDLEIRALRAEVERTSLLFYRRSPRANKPAGAGPSAVHRARRVRAVQVREQRGRCSMRRRNDGLGASIHPSVDCEVRLDDSHTIPATSRLSVSPKRHRATSASSMVASVVKVTHRCGKRQCRANVRLRTLCRPARAKRPVVMAINRSRPASPAESSRLAASTPRRLLSSHRRSSRKIAGSGHGWARRVRGVARRRVRAATRSALPRHRAAA